MTDHRVYALLLIAFAAYAVVNVIARFRYREVTRVRLMTELTGCGFLLTVFTLMLFAEPVV